MHHGLMGAIQRGVDCCGVTSPARAHREDSVSRINMRGNKTKAVCHLDIQSVSALSRSSYKSELIIYRRMPSLTSRKLFQIK